MWSRILVVAVGLLVLGGLPGVVAAHQDSYPMPATDYKKRTEQRLARYKERLEQHIIEQKIDAPTREAILKRLGALDVEIRALVDKHAKDGTITQAEATEVKELGKKRRDALYRDFKIAPDKKPAKAGKPVSGTAS